MSDATEALTQAGFKLDHGRWKNKTDSFVAFVTLLDGDPKTWILDFFDTSVSPSVRVESWCDSPEHCVECYRLWLKLGDDHEQIAKFIRELGL